MYDTQQCKVAEKQKRGTLHQYEGELQVQGIQHAGVFRDLAPS